GRGDGEGDGGIGGREGRRHRARNGQDGTGPVNSDPPRERPLRPGRSLTRPDCGVAAGADRDRKSHQREPDRSPRGSHGGPLLPSCGQNSFSNSTNSVPDNRMATGSVRTHAISRFRTVDICRPDRLAAIVPATPDERTWVVETGRPNMSAAAMVTAATSSAEAPCAYVRCVLPIFSPTVTTM